VKALRPHVEQPIERGGQDVLPGVLLHVIDAPLAIDRAPHRIAGLQRDRAFDHMTDVAIFFIDHVHDFRADTRRGQRPRIERLSAGRRIERGAVEAHPRTLAIRGDARHGRVEFEDGRIGVIDARRRRHHTPREMTP
jgi:hypothetical protein